MKFLFVTYCMGNAYGQIQIGVYKRGLRVALHLADRGHEVLFFCTGRQNFHDAQTRRAEEVLEFVDIRFEPAKFEAAERNRSAFLTWLNENQPDVVVVGEAPMAGTLLESTLTAVEAGIPVVMLDNAYHPAAVDDFLRRHGSVFDGVILSGPSALQGKSDYAHVTQLPPFIDISREKTDALLADVGLGRANLMLLLAYDRKVEELGFSLLEKLADPSLDALFICREPAELQARMDARAPGLVGRTAVIPPPTDTVLFGLLQAARCAVTKCAFMQVTESLTLHTPVIGFYYEGDFSLDILPRAMRAFSHMTDDVEADAATVATARRFLALDRARMRAVHDGSLEAAARAADYLEGFPRLPRRDTTPEVSRLGFRKRELRQALTRLEGETAVEINQLRASYLRRYPNHHLYLILCDYSVAGQRKFARLWGRLFPIRWGVREEKRLAEANGSGRRVLLTSLRRGLLLELDRGEEVLPSIKDLQKQRDERP